MLCNGISFKMLNYKQLGIEDNYHFSHTQHVVLIINASKYAIATPQ